MPGLDPVVFLSPSSIGTAIEVTVASLASPTELNTRAAAQGDLIVTRTVAAGTDDCVVYYADTTSDAESLPYIVSSATAGVKFVAIAGRYRNGTEAIAALTASRVVTTDASKNLATPATVTTGQAWAFTSTVTVAGASVGVLGVATSNDTTPDIVSAWDPAKHIVLGGAANSTTASAFAISYNQTASEVALISLTPGVAWRRVISLANDFNWRPSGSATNQMTLSSSGVLTLSAATGTTLTVSSTTDSTSKDTGSIVTEGGIAGEKNFISAQGIHAGVSSTATAAGTTTLTSASRRTQIFTGTTTQTLQLPAANLFGAGIAVEYIVVNRSTGTVTAQRAGSDTFDGGGTTDAILTNTTRHYVSNGSNQWHTIA